MMAVWLVSMRWKGFVECVDIHVLPVLTSPGACRVLLGCIS